MRFLLRLAYNLLRLITWPVWGLFPRFRRKTSAWVSLRIQGEIQELPHSRGRLLERLTSRLRPAHLSVFEVRKLARAIVEDPNARGLILTLTSVRGGWATLESLRQVLVEVPRAGKRLVVALPQGADQRELWLASAGDHVCASEPAAFSALGPVAQRPYLAGLLSKLGVQVQVFAQGDYKTAAESLARETMSAPEREQLGALLATIQGRWLRDIGSRTGAERAEQVLQQAMFGPHEALRFGLVDRVCYADELEAELELDKVPARAFRPYLRAQARTLFVPLTRPRKLVALVRLHGAIGATPNPRGISLAATRGLLRKLSEDPRVVGVVLHIDSPGGSAVVSDLLHREIVRLDARKPVVAWMGDVAASGGYYLAAAARFIVARPTTITGSIGVISARPVASELMARWGVRSEVVKLAPHADLHSLRAADERETAMIQAETRRYYERFLAVVAEGRKRPLAEIEGLAGGRIWSGADALANGLVDQLGGYAEARAKLDELLGEQAKQLPEQPEFYEPQVQPTGSDQIAIEVERLLGAAHGAAPNLLSLRALLEDGERVLAWTPPLDIS
ncbi:MAG: signal peptide peptidase SppA [Myxococcales bacterium]